MCHNGHLNLASWVVTGMLYVGIVPGTGEGTPGGDSHGLLEVSVELSLLLRYCVEWLSDRQLNRFYRKQMAN